MRYTEKHGTLYSPPMLLVVLEVVVVVEVEVVVVVEVEVLVASVVVGAKNKKPSIIKC